MSVALATATNTSFSKKLPGLQLAVDSTSLGEFKTCPRKYYYRIILGLQPNEESVHLTFGILLHTGSELYDKFKAKGFDHEVALLHVVKWAMTVTWNKALQRPAFTGTPEKNRLTLLRSLVWYLDQYEGGEATALQPFILKNGKPAVELSFHFDSGAKARSTGEPISLCGHLDKIKLLNDRPYIMDIKSTKSTLSPHFFAQFNPHNQFSLYSLAGQVAFDQPTAGLIIDAVQVGVNFSRMHRELIQRDQAQIDEWLGMLGYWLQQMEVAALAASWPMNETSCDKYGGCDFRSICSKSPASRQLWLDKGFRQQQWDPLSRRTDI